MTDITIPAELVKEKIPDAAEGTVVSLSVQLNKLNPDGSADATIDAESIMVEPPGEMPTEEEMPPETEMPTEEPETESETPAAVTAVMKGGGMKRAIKRGEMEEEE